MKFLLDTNVISEIRKRDQAHPNVARWVADTPVREMGTSVLVLADGQCVLEWYDEGMAPDTRHILMSATKSAPPWV